MKCEICDRDVREIWRRARRSYDGAWFQGLPNPFPGPFPAGEGRRWEVLHVPLAVRAVLALPMQYDVANALIYRVYTCGDDVCVFRAKANGVPGAVYRQPARRHTA